MISKPITFRLTAYSDAAGKSNPAAPLNGNEDNFFVADDLGPDADADWQTDREQTSGPCGCLMMVADGMGGMNAGEVASAIAVEVVAKAVAPGRITSAMAADAEQRKRFLEHVIRDADKAIKDDASGNPGHQGMGSTIILAWIVGNELTLSWCGDSRAYRFNPLSGLEPLSTDHSYVQELVNKGKLSYEDTFNHPQGNIVTRSLGDPNGPARPETRQFRLYDNDILLLCSDGLSGVLRDRKTLDRDGRLYPGENIEDIIAANCSTLAQCRDALMAAAERADWYDNVTVLLLEVLGGAGKAPVGVQKPETRKSGSRWRRMGLWLLIAVLVVVAAVVAAVAVGSRPEQEETVAEEPVTVDEQVDTVTPAVEEASSIAPEPTGAQNQSSALTTGEPDRKKELTPVPQPSVQTPEPACEETVDEDVKQDGCKSQEPKPDKEKEKKEDE